MDRAGRVHVGVTARCCVLSRCPCRCAESTCEAGCVVIKVYGVASLADVGASSCSQCWYDASRIEVSRAQSVKLSGCWPSTV